MKDENGDYVGDTYIGADQSSNLYYARFFYDNLFFIFLVIVTINMVAGFYNILRKKIYFLILKVLLLIHSEI